MFDLSYSEVKKYCEKPALITKLLKYEKEELADELTIDQVKLLCKNTETPNEIEAIKYMFEYRIIETEIIKNNIIDYGLLSLLQLINYKFTSPQFYTFITTYSPIILNLSDYFSYAILDPRISIDTIIELIDSFSPAVILGNDYSKKIFGSIGNIKKVDDKVIKNLINLERGLIQLKFADISDDICIKALKYRTIPNDMARIYVINSFLNSGYETIEMTLTFLEIEQFVN